MIAKTMVDYDLIIIGGGPSGSLAAYQAARGGLKVLIVEKEAFPRVKPCAGGLTGRSLHWLPFSVAEVVEASTSDLHVAYQYEKPKILKGKGTFCAFVVREKFDAYLLSKAKAEGVEVRIDLKLKDISEIKDHVEATFACGTKLISHFLIGADGANSLTRKLLKETGWSQRSYALEGLVPKTSTPYQFDMQFDFGIVEGGYGWIFPKGDHYNVGLFITSKDYSLSRDELNTYTQKRLGTDDIRAVVGFSIGTGGAGYKPKQKRIILVGDAAGLAEPLFGEGLHHAIKSGVIAGNAAVDAQSDGAHVFSDIYFGALKDQRREVERLCEIAWDSFYPKLKTRGMPFLKFPLVARPFMRGTATGMGLRAIYKNIVRCFFTKPKVTSTIADFHDMK